VGHKNVVKINPHYRTPLKLLEKGALYSTIKRSLYIDSRYHKSSDESHLNGSTPTPLTCYALRSSPLLPQGQADLLKHAGGEVQENLRQIHYAALTSNLSKGGAAGGGGSAGSESKSRRGLEAIPEKAPVEGEELPDEVH